MKSFRQIAVPLALWWFTLSGQIVSADATISVAPEIKPAGQPKEIRKKLPHSFLHGLWDTTVHVRLPPLDLVEIKAKDSKQDVQEKALRIGVVRELPQKVVSLEGKSNLGTWKKLPDGSDIWRLTIESPNAIGIRVHVEGLSIPKQCEIAAYNTLDPSQLRGPYTDRSIGGRSEFWTGTVFSENVTVEFYCPPDVSINKIGITVDQVVHIYRDPLSMEKEGSCHNDVTCSSTWSSAANGVAGIVIVEGSDLIWCTGSLIADADPSTYIDYFMTANHCVGNQSKADDTEYFWFFQTSTCDEPPPNISSVPSTDGGADYLAGQTSDSGNDFAFLLLRNDPPEGVTYAGWTSSPETSDTLTGIHHPEGTYKRISFGNLDSSDINYWYVQWFSGVTEPGSSGSPLFDDNQYFIGQLRGGFSSCSNPNGVDLYGRFNVTYPHIASWLSGSEGDDTYEPNNTLGTAYDFTSEKTWLSTLDGLGIQADDDWYEINVSPSGYERVQVDCLFSDAEGDIDIQLVDAAGTILAKSTSTSDNEFIDHVVPSAGTYYIRVYYDNEGNTYDLWWDDVQEDAYEPNNTLGTAYDFTSEKTWLSTLDGLGIQADDDWYEINVSPSGYERVQVDCLFSDAEGNIDIQLVDAAGTILANSTSTSDNEFIDHVVPSAGTYYIRVYYDNEGNTYDLWWDDISPTSPGTLQFKSPTYSVDENSGSIRIYVSRTGGSYGTGNVNYTTANGTATADSDYTALSDQLTWSDGDRADKYFDVLITNDSKAENSETFTVNLSGASGASLGSPSSASVTINDDEAYVPPEIDSLSLEMGRAGTEVTITGNNFGTNQGTGYVTFHENLTATIVLWSDTEIVCIVPEGVESGCMSVTTDQGASSCSIFTVIPNSLPFIPLLLLDEHPFNLKSEEQ